jgi:putative ABC transport system permease protein
LTSSDYLGTQDVVSDVQIIGVIQSERTASPGLADPPVVYTALAQAPSRQIDLLLHYARESGTLLPAIRRAIHELDPNLPLADLSTMQQVRDATLSGVRRPTSLIGAFASIAVLLAAIGLYGVVSFSVVQRRREIGIRMALGARKRDVLSEVLQGALTTVAIGLAIGLVGVGALTRVLRSLLFEVSPLDPFAMVAACFVILLVGALAGFLPANRAAGTDAAATLRDLG